MADGLLALQALAHDLDAGPRVKEDAPARRKVPQGDAASKTTVPTKPYFGFGPAR